MIAAISEVTRLLAAISDGKSAASDELLPLVYDELRQLARLHMARERADHTLEPTALVHEAYLRLLGPAAGDAPWNSRGHFFAAAAEAMRRILIENARAKQRLPGIAGGGIYHKTFFDNLTTFSGRVAKRPGWYAVSFP